MSDTLELEPPARAVVANGATLRAMSRIRNLLHPWPKVLPSIEDPTIRPLAIGIDKEILQRLTVPKVDAEAATAQVRVAIRTLAMSPEYRKLVNVKDVVRYDIDGNPDETTAQPHQPRETIVVSVQVKALKVAATVDASQLRPVPQGVDVKLSVQVDGGITAIAKLNAKSYRKAIATIATLGPSNVCVTVQGRMINAGVIDDAGIFAQPKAKKKE